MTAVAYIDSIIKIYTTGPPSVNSALKSIIKNPQRYILVDLNLISLDKSINCCLFFISKEAAKLKSYDLIKNHRLMNPKIFFLAHQHDQQ